MNRFWLGLLCLGLVMAGSYAHAQINSKTSKTEEKAKPGSMQIEYVVDKDKTTYWELWRENDDGQYVLALPFNVKLKFEDKIASDGDSNVTRKLELLADRALIWFDPDPGENPKDDTDAIEALGKGIRNMQFYGEGNVWMRYAVGGQSVTIRADRVYLDFARGVILRYDKNGKAKSSEEMKISGRMDNVRAHSGAGEEDEKSTPLKTGVGAGDAAEAAESEENIERVGASPNDDAKPEAAGTPNSLPQERGVRLFLRAKQLRILSLQRDLQEIELEDGSVSSSSLAVASYSFASELLTIRLTPTRKMLYLTRPSFRILDLPLLTIPVDSYGYDLESVFPLRQFDFVNTTELGFGFRSYVDLIAAYDWFLDPEPTFRPFQLGPQLDYFSKRGLGAGVNLDWGGIRPFRDFGRASMRTYYINDPGDKRQRARELGFYPVERHDRGRIHAMYSQYFGGGWYLEGRGSWHSDRNFQREFYEGDYNNNFPIDSYIQMTKRYGPMNAYMIVAPRVHPFENKTEYLPAIGFQTRRVPITDFGLQISSETQLALLHFRPTDKDDRRRLSVLRGDTRTWFNLPMDWGFMAIDPFAGARVTVASQFLEIPDGSSRPGLSADGTFPGLVDGVNRRDGFLYRVIPFFGANAQTFLTATYPSVKVPLLNIHGLRHVFSPFVRYINAVYNSLDDVPERAFVPLDGIDVLDEHHEIRFGFRNRLLTRQGKGAGRRTVDYLEFGAEISFYPQRKRDNNGDYWSELEAWATWRPAPGFAVSGRMFLDPYSGNFNRANASFRFNIFNIGQGNLYYRLLKGQHQVVGLQVDLQVSEVYRVGVKQEYDMQVGQFRDTRIEVVRRVLEAVDVGAVFVYDSVEEDFGFYFSISAAFKAIRGGSSLVR